MKLLLTTILFIISVVSYAQQISPEVISSAGDYFENDDISLSWTMGEPVISTLNGEYILTQGFHQDLYIITAVDELEFFDFDIHLFPNPTPDYLNIEINQKGNINQEMIIQLLDIKGSLIKEFKESGNFQSTQINLQAYERANYFLRFIINNQTKTFKIVKT